MVIGDGMTAALRSGSWVGETAALVTLAAKEFPVSQVLVAHKAADGARAQFLSTMIRATCRTATAWRISFGRHKRWRRWDGWPPGWRTISTTC